MRLPDYEPGALQRRLVCPEKFRRPLPFHGEEVSGHMPLHMGEDMSCRDFLFPVQRG